MYKKKLTEKTSLYIINSIHKTFQLINSNKRIGKTVQKGESIIVYRLTFHNLKQGQMQYMMQIYYRNIKEISNLPVR